MVRLFFYEDCDGSDAKVKYTGVHVSIDHDTLFKDAISKALLLMGPKYLGRGFGFSVEPVSEFLIQWKTILASDTPKSIGCLDDEYTFNIRCWRYKNPYEPNNDGLCTTDSVINQSTGQSEIRYMRDPSGFAGVTCGFSAETEGSFS